MFQLTVKKNLIIISSIVSVLTSAHVQSATPQVRGQWAAAMGESSLRRFYSAGGDMGEVVNRVVSYQTANRVWQSQQGRPGAPSPSDMRSRTGSMFAEVAFDYEIDTNMAVPIDDRAGMVYSAALVRQLACGKRVQILLDRFQHLDDDRSRNSVTLIGVIDF